MESAEVYGSAFATLEERLTAVEVNILKFGDTNERNQAAIKRVNDALEDHNVVLNGVKLIMVEEIHPIFVRQPDLETTDVENEIEGLNLNTEDGWDL